MTTAAEEKKNNNSTNDGKRGDDGTEEEDDDREEETATYIWMVATGVASLAMAWAGKLWMAGMLAVVAGLFWASSHLLQPLSVAERKAIEYNIWSAEDCYAELQQQPPHRLFDDVSQLALLAALSKKYTNIRNRSMVAVGAADGENKPEALLSGRREEVALISHNAAHEIIRKKMSEKNDEEQDQDQDQQQQLLDDQVVDAAIALLALVATESPVRRSYGADDDGRRRLANILSVLQQALLRAKRYRDNGAQEQQAAELQRKGCLLLGALANRNHNTTNAAVDEPVSLGQRIVAQGGIKCIVDALAWFRCHEHVANWALWAIFTLLYDQEDGDDNDTTTSDQSVSVSSSSTNRTTNTAIQQLLNANGGPAILAALEECGHDVDVARHGMAIIFHLVVAQNIPLPPAPVIRIVELLMLHHTTTATTFRDDNHVASADLSFSTTATTAAESRIPTNPDDMSHSAPQQFALMGRAILVRLGCNNNKSSSTNSNTNEK
jgi:hypothetical protein